MRPFVTCYPVLLGLALFCSGAAAPSPEPSMMAQETAILSVAVEESPAPSASLTAAPVVAAVTAVSATVAPAPTLSVPDFFGQVLATIHAFGGVSMVAKIAMIVLLIVSSMKVTFLNRLIWSKLGSAQAWVAPLLGLLAGILDIAKAGGAITPASVLAYVSAGAGAIIFHELLDGLKGVPGLGPVYIAFIEAVEKSFGGPSATQTKT